MRPEPTKGRRDAAGIREVVMMDAKAAAAGRSALRAGYWAIPVAAPVNDIDGERAGVAIGAIDDCLVVRPADVVEDHVPFVAAVGATAGSSASPSSPTRSTTATSTATPADRGSPGRV